MGDEEQPEPEPKMTPLRWRHHELVKAGYPTIAAAQLAVRPDIDLHDAVKLIERGCDPLVAIDILL